ncbi:MAG: ribosome-associated protein [Solirubrobacterales bacterium]|nr:ribosome-associated protein [Solirubrobacterales bacterium]
MSAGEPQRREDEIAARRVAEADASLALARRLAAVAVEKGAEDLVALDVRVLVGYTDYLLVCTARNERLAKAIHDEVYLRLKREDDLLPASVEGEREARWILLDYFDCVLHIFVPELRERYRLERLWGEAPNVDLESE